MALDDALSGVVNKVVATLRQGFIAGTLQPSSVAPISEQYGAPLPEQPQPLPHPAHQPREGLTPFGKRVMERPALPEADFRPQANFRAFGMGPPHAIEMHRERHGLLPPPGFGMGGKPLPAPVDPTGMYYGG